VLVLGYIFSRIPQNFSYKDDSVTMLNYKVEM